MIPANVNFFYVERKFIELLPPKPNYQRKGGFYIVL